VFSPGPLAEVRPGLKVRRAQRRPHRLGFAVPGEWRLSVTAYPGIRAGDVLETLLHELVHLHVGRQPGGHAWHGRAFKGALAAAMAEAYRVVAPAPARSTVHGAYAAAIERRRPLLVQSLLEPGAPVGDELVQLVTELGDVGGEGRPAISGPSGGRLDLALEALDRSP